MTRELSDAVTIEGNDAVDFTAFEKKHAMVDQHYRRGLFESRLNKESYDILTDEISGGILLQDAAAELAKKALRKLSFLEPGAGDRGRVRLTTGEFKAYARSIVNSYEVSDYFLDYSWEDMDRFLKNVLDSIERESNKAAPKFSGGLKEAVTVLVKGHLTEGEAGLPESDVAEIADELLLMALCAVSTIYRGHRAQNYEDALNYLTAIGRMIDELSTLKKQESFGLLGLHRYLLGRVRFARGELKLAEDAFSQSAKFYSERIRSKARGREEVSPSGTVGEAPILSLRRATLARCLGSAYLYFVQSKLEKAVDLLRIGVPILTLDCGRVNAANCDLIEAMATRALYADDDEKLKQCEKKVMECRDVFEKYVPGGHYLRRCLMELVRIKDCRAKIIFDAHGVDATQEELGGLRDLLNNEYNEIYGMLDQVLTFAGEARKLEDRRRGMLTAALILRSQTRRHHLRMLHKMKQLSSNPLDLIDECVRDAEEASKTAGTMKKLKCEALLALGQSLLFRHFVATEGMAEKSAEDEKVLREEIRKKYFSALTENDGENPKVTAVALLCLTELEMTGRTNYYYAKRYFERYEKAAPHVEDRKCRLFAEELRKRLDRPYTDFFVDITARKGMGLDKWKGELEKFLVRQVMYRIARERKGELPIKDKKGDTAGQGDNNEGSANNGKPISGKPGRETKQSLLTEGLHSEFGLSRASASALAGDHLDEFKEIARHEKRLAYILNSPD